MLTARPRGRKAARRSVREFRRRYAKTTRALAKNHLVTMDADTVARAMVQAARRDAEPRVRGLEEAAQEVRRQGRGEVRWQCRAEVRRQCCTQLR
jgi:hypothetical protein